MHDIKTGFDKILEVLKSILEKEVDSKGNFPKVGKKPKFSDLELISLNLTSEYLSIDSENLLFKKLETPLRKNRACFKKQPYILRKSRKRIEILYSHLCDQFLIRRNYAKTFTGFKTRIISKITSLTVIQYINKFIFNRPINLLKHAI